MFQILDNILIFIYKKKIHSFDRRRHKQAIFSHYSYSKLNSLTNEFFKKKILSNQLYHHFRTKNNKKLLDLYLKKLIFYKLKPINHQINLFKEFYDEKKVIYFINDFDINFLFDHFKLKRINILYLNIFLIHIKICIKNIRNIFYINQFSFLKKKDIPIKLKFKSSILINEYFGLNLNNKNDLFFIKLLNNKYNIFFYDYKNFFLIDNIDFKCKKLNKIKFKIKTAPLSNNFNYSFFNIFDYTLGFLKSSIHYFQQRKYFWDSFVKNYNIKFVINNPANSYDIFPLKLTLTENNSKLINFQNSSFTNIKGLFYLHYISDYFFCFSNLQKKLGLNMNNKMFYINKLVNVNNFFDLDYCIDNIFYKKIKKFKSDKILLLFTDSSISIDDFFEQVMSITELDIYYLSLLKILNKYKSNIKILIKAKKIKLYQLKLTTKFIHNYNLNNLIFFDDLNHSRNFAVYSNIADIYYSISHEFPSTLLQLHSTRAKFINFDYGGSLNIKLPKIKSFKNFQQSLNELESAINMLIVNKTYNNKSFKYTNNSNLLIKEINKIM